MPQRRMPPSGDERARQVLMSTYMRWTRDEVTVQGAFQALTQVCSREEAASTIRAWRTDQNPRKERRV